jgi:ribosomal protein S18 acetylase RimI-like enzyme
MLDELPNLSSLGLAVTRRQSGPDANLTELCRRCEVFFTLVADPAEPATRAKSVLVGRPPSVEAARKFVLGIERNHDLVGIVDLLEGYPGEAECYVGLFLFLPEERNQGLGRAVWAAIEQWIHSRGARVIRLIVQEQNADAARFWRSVGFEAHEQVQQILATRTNLCWRFGKALTGTTP